MKMSGIQFIYIFFSLNVSNLYLELQYLDQKGHKACFIEILSSQLAWPVSNVPKSKSECDRADTDTYIE